MCKMVRVGLVSLETRNDRAVDAEDWASLQTVMKIKPAILGSAMPTVPYLGSTTAAIATNMAPRPNVKQVILPPR